MFPAKANRCYIKSQKKKISFPLGFSSILDLVTYVCIHITILSTWITLKWTIFPAFRVKLAHYATAIQIYAKISSKPIGNRLIYRIIFPNVAPLFPLLLLFDESRDANAITDLLQRGNDLCNRELEDLSNVSENLYECPSMKEINDVPPSCK